MQPQNSLKSKKNIRERECSGALLFPLNQHRHLLSAISRPCLNLYSPSKPHKGDQADWTSDVSWLGLTLKGLWVKDCVSKYLYLGDYWARDAAEQTESCRGVQRTIKPIESEGKVVCPYDGTCWALKLSLAHWTKPARPGCPPM